MPADTAMSFLFATMPFDGHFNPLTGIAMHLKERGHDVRWYAGPSYAEKLRALEIPHHPFQRAREVNGENIGEVFPERARLSGPKLISFEMKNIFVANCGAHFKDIAAIREELPFDALFCDEALYASKLVAEKLQVPVYAVGLGPPTFNSRDAPPNFFGLKPARSIVGRLHHRIVGAMLNRTMKDGMRLYNELLVSEGLEPLRAPRDFFDVPVEASTSFFQNGVPGFEYPRTDLPDNVRYVGPLLPHRTAIATRSPRQEKLNSHPSTIVVSQGTVDNKDAGKLIVPTLEALAGTEHLVIATTGGRNTAELRARFPADNVVIEDFVDFDALFDHADLLICNGGYGSILMALAKGIPILSAGTREGKNDINARIDYFGLGINLRTEHPTPKNIARGVARILADPRFAGNVARVRAELESYDPFELIERYLALHSTVAPTRPSDLGDPVRRSR
jgi:UDP:flavonoid glycosyltransferase YjiC (YdhE family)